MRRCSDLGHSMWSIECERRRLLWNNVSSLRDTFSQSHLIHSSTRLVDSIIQIVYSQRAMTLWKSHVYLVVSIVNHHVPSWHPSAVYISKNSMRNTYSFALLALSCSLLSNTLSACIALYWNQEHTNEEARRLNELRPLAGDTLSQKEDWMISGQLPAAKTKRWNF